MTDLIEEANFMKIEARSAIASVYMLPPAYF
jgi:hypothetical protein